MRGPRQFKKRVVLSIVVLLSLMASFTMFSVTGTFAQENTDTHEDVSVSQEQPEVVKFGLIAAAVAFGFGAIGAGIAIANVGAAAMGAIGEKPELAGRALIFVGLAEGIAIYGLIIAIMILGKV